MRNLNKTFLVEPENISEIISFSIGANLMFLPKLRMLGEINSVGHILVNNWTEVEELGKNDSYKLLLVYGYFKSGALIGHYVAVNFCYFNGKGIILDGCHSKKQPHNSISFIYNREIAELFLEKPIINFNFIPTNNTLNNLFLL